MDIITEFAKKVTRTYDAKNGSEVLKEVKSKLSDLDNKLDKIKFIKHVLEHYNSIYEEHKPNCTSPNDCEINIGHETIAYYLTQELNRLGVHLNEDTFTVEEKENAENKLDQILKDLKEVRVGQQIIYEDLLKEIEELKTLYFLGKKNWLQLFMGKSLDMAASGIVSETVSKEIIEQIKNSIPKLIG